VFTKFDSNSLNFQIPARMMRDRMLEEGQLFDISKLGNECGLRCKSAITNGLFKEIYPWAEDAVKGKDFVTRIEDIIALLHDKISGTAQSDYVEFEYTFPTYVSKVESFEKIHTFKDGKTRDKMIKIFVVWMPDQSLMPSLLFGFHDKELRGGKEVFIETPKAVSTHEDYKRSYGVDPLGTGPVN